MIDGPHMGPAPAPWEIPCACTQLFKNEVKKLEVPHTTSVRVRNMADVFCYLYNHTRVCDWTIGFLIEKVYRLVGGKRKSVLAVS